MSHIQSTLALLGILLIVSCKRNNDQATAQPSLEEVILSSIKHMSSSTKRNDKEALRQLLFLESFNWGSDYNVDIEHLLMLYANSKSPKIRLQLAKYFLSKNNLDSCIHHWQYAWSSGLESDEMYTLKGTLEMKQQNYTSAIDWYNQSITINPNNAENQIGKGNALLELGDTVTAVKCFEDYLSYAPTNKSILNQLLALYSHLNQNDKFINTINQLLAAGGTVDNYEIVMARYLDADGKYDSAKNILIPSISTTTYGQEIFNELCDLLLRYKSADSVLLFSNQLLSIDSTLTTPYIQIARAYESKWYYSSALRSYQKALELSPKDQDIAARVDAVQRKIAYLRRLTEGENTSSNPN